MKTSVPLVLGAVAYSPKVVTIWEGFKEYFCERAFSFDYVLFSNYERQVEALFAEMIDVAWNSPLAWIRAERMGRSLGKPVEAILMRDSDRDLSSVLLVRRSAGFQSSKDLKGRTIGFGAVDSPQATLLPLEMLRRQGLLPERDFTVRYFNLLPGKHGDHIGGEEQAAQALASGDLEGACVLKANFESFRQSGLLSEDIVILEETPAFDHCNFTVGSHAQRNQVSEFRRLLLEMSYEDPKIRPLLDLEGLKSWKEGRSSGYGDLDAAVDACAFYDAKGSILRSDYSY